MPGNRPSDRAIAQALYELIETQGFLIGGTLNLVVERARELDATAAPSEKSLLEIAYDFLLPHYDMSSHPLNLISEKVNAAVIDSEFHEGSTCKKATAAPVVVGEDVMAKAWRNLYIAERMRSIEFEGMSYEMRRAHAEASANDFEDEFRERMAKPAAKTAMGGLTATLAGD